MAACQKQAEAPRKDAANEAGPLRVDPNEEYVWISANSNLPLFVAADHPALFQIGKELGVKVTIAGPNTVDIPGLVATVEWASEDFEARTGTTCRLDLPQ